jgi:hypothetical protein
MATLASAVTDHDGILTLTAPLDVGRYPTRYTLESEVVCVIGGSGTAAVSVIRGADDTDAASHAGGATLSAAPVGSGGGAGLTLDNQSDPPTAITTLVAPGATISGDEGTLPLSVVQTVITLTNDQIKALPTTPVEVVASPGANKAIVAIRGLARLEWVADYTNVDVGAEMQIDGLGPLTDVAGLLALGHSSSAFFVPTARSTAVGTFIAAESGWADEDYIDRPFVIAAVNTGDFTGGNAGNSLKVSMLYTVIDF